MNWPPSYIIKKHRRAKNVYLRFLKNYQLQLTIPFRFSKKHIPAILEENKSWILEQLSAVKKNYADELPNNVHFKINSSTWFIQYKNYPCRLKLIIDGYQLIFFGDLTDTLKAKKLLMKWIKMQAEQILNELLLHISKVTNLSYTKLSIRAQSTMWGSCNKEKNISLNYKLIFLPPWIVQYVLIHELCHTVFLNHAKQFWHLVEKFDPNWRLHKKLLREIDEHIPLWLT